MSKQSMIFCVIMSWTYSIQSLHFVLISAPGSGKGTFSQYMKTKYDYVQICPGDLFRDEIENQTDFGKKIQPIVESGNYVDEDIVCTLMQQHLEAAIQKNKKFILDGFPRSKASLNFLLDFFEKKQLINQVCFLQLQTSDSVCTQRILGRYICTLCHYVDNSSMITPQNNVCKSCKHHLTKRPGDTESVIKNRLQHFHTIIEPILESLIDQNMNVKTINSEQTLSTLERLYDDLTA